jgi:aerobic carbon-monoxide dehydrogenase medium subunit
VERRAGDWAVGASGVAVWMDGATIADAGVGLAAVGAPEMRSTRAEAALRGQMPSEELFAEAGRLAAEECNPSTDQRGSAEYKRHLAQELTKRAARRAVERALP